MSETTIGFIGLGDMGAPMAARLLDAGFIVSSCAHRRRQAIETLKQKGMIERPDLGAVAQDADILITILFWTKARRTKCSMGRTAPCRAFVTVRRSS